MDTASSASRTCRAFASASEWTATVRIPSRRAVRMTRQAISPRFAMRILVNIGHIRKTPKRVWGIGALRVAESDRPRTRRVCAGSTMPSSHSRAVA